MHRARACVVMALNIQHKILSRLQCDWVRLLQTKYTQNWFSLIPRPSSPPVFDQLQYANMGRGRPGRCNWFID